MHEILIIGTGYVGLVSGTCFAENGFKVCCLDVNQEKISRLKNGECPIFEPGLVEMLKRNIEAKRLSFTTEYKEAVERSGICIIAVDTPIGLDGSCDLSRVKTVALELAKHMNEYKVIVNKSTVPCGTGQFVKALIQESFEKQGKTCSFDVVSNPEFLKEGSAINDFMRPDRVIIGCESARAESVMKDLYRPFMFSHDRMFFMDIASSELSKYAANTMLAMRISYMNWMAELCEKTGANIHNVRKAIGSDKRIGYSFLWAGCGYGGSCLPKDVKALRATIQNNQISTKLLDAIDEINQNAKARVVEKITQYYSERGGIEQKTFAILGLSFKPDTDDCREAPSLSIIKSLLAARAKIRAYDPIAIENAKKYLTGLEITWCSNVDECVEGSHAMVLVTEWKEFRFFDFEKMQQKMRGNAFFDGRNQYDPVDVAKQGFDYISIGQNPVFSALEHDFIKPTVTVYKQ